MSNPTIEQVECWLQSGNFRAVDDLLGSIGPECFTEYARGSDYIEQLLRLSESEEDNLPQRRQLLEKLRHLYHIYRKETQLELTLCEFDPITAKRHELEMARRMRQTHRN